MKSIIKLAFLFVCSISFAQTNLLDSSTWVSGTGSVSGFNILGTSNENSRALGIGPHGLQKVLWENQPADNTGNRRGWITDYVTIDHTKTYRYTSWVKKTNSKDGSIYLILTCKDDLNSNTALNLNGSVNGAPYPFGGDPENLDEWYLLVGYIHHSGYTSTTSIGGGYDTNGIKRLNMDDYKFSNNATRLKLENILWFSTNTNDHLFTYGPTIYEVNGQEPTIQELIDGPGDTQAPTASTLSSTAQTDTSVALSWTAATDDTAVTGYKVYKGGVLESTLGNVLSYQVTGLTASTAYNFTVTALDAAGNESVVSNTLAITTSNVISGNLLDSSTWTVGTGSAPGFPMYGLEEENIREMGLGPHGTSVLLWKAVPDPITSDPAGGWHSDEHNIDHTKTYRLTIWLKNTNSLNGRSYYTMPVKNVTGDRAAVDLDGDPALGGFVGDLPTLDTWYLLVSYVNASGTPTSSNANSIGGIYDLTGIKTGGGTVDLIFLPTATRIAHNAELYDTTNALDNQYFYAPTIYEVNGQEPTIQELIDGPLDTQAPTAPTLSSASQTDTTVDLSWTAATDDTAVTGYKVYKGGVLETTLGNVLNYQVTGLTAATAYNFTVTALDAAGNESVVSNTLNITTNNPPSDSQAPTAPTLSSTAQTDTTVDLSWTAATDNTAVTNYKVYKGGVLESTLGNVLSYQVTGLTAATAYNFTVTALDASGNESVASDPLAINTNAASGGGSGNWILNNQDVYYNAGNVGIGTTTPDEKLTVKGSIHSEEVKVDLSVPAPDYVFESDYALTPLEKLQNYIKTNKHLPNIPTAKDMESNGVELGIMSMKLLEKIEELTLYILQQQKEIEQLKKNFKTKR